MSDRRKCVVCGLLTTSRLSGKPVCSTHDNDTVIRAQMRPRKAGDSPVRIIRPAKGHN